MNQVLVKFIAIVGLFSAFIVSPTLTLSAEDCGKAGVATTIICGPIDQVEAYDIWINIFSIPGIEVTEFSQRTVYVDGDDRQSQKMKVLIEGRNSHISLSKVHFKWSTDVASKSKAERNVKAWKSVTVTSAERMKTKRGWASKASWQSNGTTCALYKILTQDQKISGNVSTCSTDVFDNYFKYQFRLSSRAENIAAYGQKSFSKSDTAPKKSYVQRRCVSAENNTEDLANFIKSLSKDDLVKFLKADQNCDVF